MSVQAGVFICVFFFFSSRRRHTRSDRDWSSDVCSSDLLAHEISQRSQHAVAAMKEGIDELGQGREDLAQIILSLDEIVNATQTGSERVQVISRLAREQLQGSAEMVEAFQEIR